MSRRRSRGADIADDSTAVTESAVISREMKELKKKIEELEQIIRRALPEAAKAGSDPGEASKEKGKDDAMEDKLVDDE